MDDKTAYRLLPEMVIKIVLLTFFEHSSARLQLHSLSTGSLRPISSPFPFLFIGPSFGRGLSRPLPLMENRLLSSLLPIIMLRRTKNKCAAVWEN
jgi:hypothetical protein